MRHRLLRAAVVALALAVPAQAQALTYRPDLSAVATAIAGRPARVYCARDWNEWRSIPTVHLAIKQGLDPQAFTTPLAGRIDLDPGVCLGLGLQRDALNMGNAALVIAHESGHVAAPNASEAHVECMAWRRTPRAIRMLWPHATRRLQRAIAYQARLVHDELLSVPGYDWRGAC